MKLVNLSIGESILRILDTQAPKTRKLLNQVDDAIFLH